MKLFGRRREPERPPPTVAPGLLEWIDANATPEAPEAVPSLLEGLGLPSRPSGTGFVMDIEGAELSVTPVEGSGCLHVMGVVPRRGSGSGTQALLEPLAANAGSLGGHLALRQDGYLVALAKPPVFGLEAGALALSVEEVLRLGAAPWAGPTEERLRALRAAQRPAKEFVRERVEACLEELGLEWGRSEGGGAGGWEVTLDPGPAELRLRGEGEVLALTLVTIEMDASEDDEGLLQFLNEETDLAGAWFAQVERDGGGWLELTTTIAASALVPGAVAHGLLKLSDGLLRLFEKLRAS